MTENEFLLADRIQKIKSINELYDLEHKAYISFSGGKDSTVRPPSSLSTSTEHLLSQILL